MSWVKIKRVNVPSSEPTVSINNSRFSYNAIFVRLAELDKFNFVTYHYNEEERKIGFEFKKEEEADSFKIIKAQGKGVYSQCTELFKVAWISKVERDKELNKFRPLKNGKMWVITLLPVFENVVRRENAEKLSAEVKGIYRYVDNGRVVYIGKGLIKRRLQEPQRQNWKFDTIEYSMIDDEEKQYEWESFWIERFKSENDNCLPAYNLIAGRK